MKIAITATGPDLEANVDPRFGRCPCFLIVETDDLSFEAIQNPNLALGGGAGIQSAQLAAERGVTQVLTGNCGPNAHQTLAAAGIGVIVGCFGPIRDVIERYKTGELSPVGGPNVASHFGMGGGSAGTPGPLPGANPSFGPGMGGGGAGGMGRGGGGGMGRGGGGGMGRGGGGGMGRGGGGMGRGGGGGMGRGAGGGMGMGGGFAGPQTAPGGGEWAMPNQQAGPMNQPVQSSPEDWSTKRAIVARVHDELCTGCTVCAEVCPVSAITFEKGKAQIDAGTCIACGVCVDECPTKAITLE